jgi:ABC-type transporter Mla MlaB component
MLRISQPDERQTLRLEGRLTRYEVGLLRESLRRGPNGCEALDLSGLAFVDEAGAAVLAELRERGLELRGGSSFVRLLLEGVES